MTLEIFRGSERLLIVLASTMSIFLGYKLFLALPERNSGEGKVSMPGGISVYISRVGPGAFAMLFGTTVLIAALFRPLVFDGGYMYGSDSGNTEMSPGRSIESDEMLAAVKSVMSLRDRLEASLQRGAALKLDLEFKVALANGLPRVARAGLASVWNEDEWGAWQEFESWIDSGESAGEPPSKVPKELFMLFDPRGPKKERE